MRVLIADGSRAVRERLTDLVAEIPSVELLAPTTTGKATLKSVREHDPEVLVMDAGLLDGARNKLLQAVRIERPAAVVIVLSNLVYPRYREHYQSAGADLFLDKSNEFIQLYQFLLELVRSLPAAQAKGLTGGLRKFVTRSRIRVGLQFFLVAFSLSSLFIGP